MLRRKKVKPITLRDVTIIDDAKLRKAITAASLGNAMGRFGFGGYGFVAYALGKVFFPGADPSLQMIAALGTFSVPFLIRPLGGLFFGMLGDKYGRQKILAITIVIMSISTFLIGLIPSYATIGIWAPILLLICKMAQGFSVGGEYTGASIFVAEYSPDRKRGFMGSWLDFGSIAGFVMGAGVVVLISTVVGEENFLDWGWRIPFVFSAVLVLIGLYVRVSLHETPVFAKVAAAKKPVKVPLGTLLTKHLRVTVLGTFIMLATYTLFYIMTVYSMTYSTAAVPVGLGLPRNEVLWMLMMAVIGFGVMVPIAGLLADKFGRRSSMIVITSLIILFALFVFPPLLGSGSPALVMAYLLIGLSLMGLTFGPMGALLPELFPTEVRYTGASFSYNVSSILGASVAPYIATWLQANYGLFYVGVYLAAMAALTLIALLLTHETKHQTL